MKILVIGSFGQVGQKLVKALTAKEIVVRAMVRKKEQVSEMKKTGAEVILSDLESDFSDAYQGVDIVVFTAGSGSKTGPEKTIDIDQNAAIKSIELAKELKIKRYIMVSAQGAREPDLPSKIQHYFKAKSIADNYLINSGVDYTIFRPGRLNNGPGSMKIQVSTNILARGATNRENLAIAIAESIGLANTQNKVIEIIDGITPVRQALLQL